MKVKYKKNKAYVIYVDEKNIGIEYDGVNNKGNRPYILLNSFKSRKDIAIIPLTSTIRSNGQLKPKRNEWLELNILNKDSFIKLDSAKIYKKKQIKKMISLSKIDVNSKLKSKLRRKLHKYISNNYELLENNKKIKKSVYK